MWRGMFIARKAVICMNPGYTRRPAPGNRHGTVEITFCSNHSMGRVMARSLTAVGLTRVSIGPAISVSVRGMHGSPRLGHHRGDDQSLHARLADGHEVGARPQHVEEPHDVVDVLVEPEPTAR